MNSNWTRQDIIDVAEAFSVEKHELRLAVRESGKEFALNPYSIDERRQ